jgi:TRAP-type C4-dicarboxylate transport system permease small subunit
MLMTSGKPEIELPYFVHFINLLLTLFFILFIYYCTEINNIAWTQMPLKPFARTARSR